MNHSQLSETTLPDDATRQAWEEMRAEALHELQEGGDVSDALLNVLGDMLGKYPYQHVERKPRRVGPSST